MDEVEQDTLNFFFETIPIGDFPPPPGGQCITVNSNATITEAVEILAKHNILAAPILNVDPAADPKKKFLGIIDMVNIACFLLDQMYEEHRTFESFHKHEIITGTKLQDLDPKHWSPFLPLKPSDSLLDAMLIMGQYGVHRVPVVGDDGALINIITQSAVVDQLAKNMDQFASIGSKTLESLGLANHVDCFTVTIDSTLRAAIKAIRDHNVSAVPVLGINGAVVGNVSARDLRQLILNPAIFRLISLPVRQFLSVVSRDSVEHEAMAPAITCRPKDTMQHVILQLAASKIHRTYVCDNHGRLVRVISLTDVISKFVSPPSAEYFDRFQ